MITKTKTKPPVEETVIAEAPAPQLPAVVVQQERKPRMPAQPRPATYPPKIAKAIVAITKAIGRIQKEGYNDFQKYRYTRWEDIAEKLSPLLAEHGLIIIQNEQTRHLIEENDKGSTLSIVYDFTLVNEDGDVWPSSDWTALARLRDQKGVTDDKAASKCHTQAEKNFVIKLFKIVSDEGYDDGDHHATAPKKDLRPVYQAFQDEMDAVAKEAIEHGEPSSFYDWANRNKDRLKTYPKDWQGIITDRYNDWKVRIAAALEQTVEDEPQQNEPEFADAARSAPGSAAAAAKETSPPAAAAAPSLEDMARAEAKRGPDALRAFFNKRNAQEKAQLRKIEADLVALYPQPEGR